jgi:hypothetical protein
MVKLPKTTIRGNAYALILKMLAKLKGRFACILVSTTLQTQRRI